MTPVRNLVLVERIREDVSRSGLLILPQAFKRKHPTDKHKVQPDYWRGRVEAVGPDVRELRPGDEVLVHTWAEIGDGLYTGIDADTGAPARIIPKRAFLSYPDDIVCALDPDDSPEAA